MNIGDQRLANCVVLASSIECYCVVDSSCMVVSVVPCVVAHCCRPTHSRAERSRLVEHHEELLRKNEGYLVHTVYHAQRGNLPWSHVLRSYRLRARKSYLKRSLKSDSATTAVFASQFITRLVSTLLYATSLTFSSLVFPVNNGQVTRPTLRRSHFHMFPHKGRAV